MDCDISDNSPNEHLKCGNCKNYLSYMPIYLTIRGQNICGRCPVIITKKTVRNLAFEVLCQSARFPCRFVKEGCEEKMFPKDIPDHEQVCHFRIIKCPSVSFTCCDWKGAFPAAVQHCRDKHMENFLLENGDFTVDLMKCYQSENFIIHDQKLYIFSRKFDNFTKILQCAIFHIDGEINVNNYSCKLTLKNGTRILSDECCTTAYHRKEYVSISLDSLKTENLPIVAGRITVDKHIEDEAAVQARINEQLLSELQCSECATYVFPPIYHHKDNKIYCSDCKSGYQFRNYNLDNIANMLNYPCKYRNNGCNVILKPEQMKKHQKMCEYGDHDCLFWEQEECLWKGAGKDMVPHIEKSHKEMIIENGGEISEYGDDDGLTKCYMIKFSNHVFKMVFWMGWSEVEDMQVFKWTVQKVGYFEGTYKYEIEVISKNDRWRKLVGRKLCSLLKFEPFEYKSEYLYFTNEQLEGLLEDSCITFKVSIFQ